MLSKIRKHTASAAAMMAGMALSALGGAAAHSMPIPGKGQQGNKYNKFIGVSAEILQHNERIDAEQAGKKAHKQGPRKVRKNSLRKAKARHLADQRSYLG